MARDTFEKSAQVRPSFVGRTWRGAKAAVRMSFSGTFAAFPAAAIRENARVIRLLFNQVRSGPEENNRNRSFRTENGRIALAATPFNLAMSDATLEMRIRARRRQTALLSYGSFVLGCAFVALWVIRGVTSGLSGPHLLGALQFTPFVAIFFLVAFKNAHINWQLRTGVLGSAADYLRSPEPFLPR